MQAAWGLKIINVDWVCEVPLYRESDEEENCFEAWLGCDVMGHFCDFSVSWIRMFWSLAWSRSRGSWKDCHGHLQALTQSFALNAHCPQLQPGTVSIAVSLEAFAWTQANGFTTRRLCTNRKLLELCHLCSPFPSAFWDTGTSNCLSPSTQLTCYKSYTTAP